METNSTLQNDLRLEKDRVEKLTEEKDALEKKIGDLEAESAETASNHKIGNLESSRIELYNPLHSIEYLYHLSWTKHADCGEQKSTP